MKSSMKPPIGDIPFGTKSQLELSPPDMSRYVGHSLQSVERNLILSTLQCCGGNRTWAAEILGITLLELRDKLLRHHEFFVSDVSTSPPSSSDESHTYDPSDSILS